MEPVSLILGVAALFLLGSGGSKTAPAKRGPAGPDIDEREAAEADVAAETIAPIVASVFGTPAAGAAVTGVDTVLNAGITDPEQKLAALAFGASTGGLAPAAIAFGEDNPKVGAAAADVGKNVNSIKASLDKVTEGFKL